MSFLGTQSMLGIVRGALLRAIPTRSVSGDPSSDRSQAMTGRTTVKCPRLGVSICRRGLPLLIAVVLADPLAADPDRPWEVFDFDAEVGVLVGRCGPESPIEGWGLDHEVCDGALRVIAVNRRSARVLALEEDAWATFRIDRRAGRALWVRQLLERPERAPAAAPPQPVYLDPAGIPDGELMIMTAEGPVAASELVAEAEEPPAGPNEEEEP